MNSEIIVWLRNVITSEWKSLQFSSTGEAADYFAKEYVSSIANDDLEDEIMLVRIDGSCLYSALGVRSENVYSLTYSDLIDFFKDEFTDSVQKGYDGLMDTNDQLLYGLEKEEY